MFGRNPDEPITNFIHIKGCNLGRVRPFLLKFKQALGNKIFVTAPKHFHFVHPIRNRGTLEYMAYEFIIRTPTVFSNQTQVIQAFQQAGLKLINGEPVPNVNWQTWIPSRIDRGRRTRVWIRLSQNIGRLTRIPCFREFQVSNRGYIYTINYPDSTAVPTSYDARLQALKSNIQSQPQFKPNHEFPVYKQYGYETFDDFFKGYTWKFFLFNHGRQLFCSGSRFEYMLLDVITDPDTGLLEAFNFYPENLAGVAINQLSTTHTDYFEKV